MTEDEQTIIRQLSAADGAAPILILQDETAGLVADDQLRERVQELARAGRVPGLSELEFRHRTQGAVLGAGDLAALAGLVRAARVTWQGAELPS